MERDMDDVQWRRKARIVAYIDLILSVIGIVGTILGAILIISKFDELATYFSRNGDDKSTKRDYVSEALCTRTPIYCQNPGLALAMIGFGLIIALLELWAAIKLKSSTEPGRDFLAALNLSTLWMWINIVHIVVDLVSSLITAGYYSNIISVVIRLLFIYIVYRFRKELQLRLAITNPNNGPSAVYVNK